MRIRAFVLSFVLLFIMASAQASSLQLCPASLPSPGGMETIITGADGTDLRIRISEEPLPGCRSMPLPVAASAVAALHPLAVHEAKQIGKRFVVLGVQRDNAFIISSISAVQESEQPARWSMPLQENLLAGMTVRAFGVEERAQAALVDGKLKLRCTAGQKPAGVVLSADRYMPLAPAKLQISASGNGRFEVAMADAVSTAKDTSTLAGHIDGNSSATLAIPAEGFDRAGWRQFSVTCPSHPAELTLDDFRLVPEHRQAGERSTWVWEPQQWSEHPEQVLGHAQAYGIRNLFISVPVTNGAVAQANQLAAFVRRASALGIEVWSVDGDPQMVKPGEHAATITRARAYTVYNQRVDPAARLRGMQFDIEHYLLPGYGTSAVELDRHYLALARALRAAAGTIPLEFVVPFWWSDKTELLNGLSSAASGLNVMDYRTDPMQIREFAIPFLDWGVKYGKKIRIAVESGPIEEEQLQRFVKAEDGHAWLVTLEKIPVLILLREAHPNPHGPAFRLESRATIDGSATSFFRNPAAMLDVLPTLEYYFSAWPSFNGMALHGLK